MKGVLNFSPKPVDFEELSFTGEKSSQSNIFEKPNIRPQIRHLHWFPAQASAQSSCPENPDEILITRLRCL